VVRTEVRVGRLRLLRTNGSALQKDCMLPIANGGRYTLANVVPSCPSCNASKCNAEVTTWLRRKKLDERSFLMRQAEIVRSIPVPRQSITLSE
jgi:hypothetical protein